MSKETSVFVLGIVVFFGTFVGIPTEYKEWIFIISGILLMAIGYRLRRNAFLRSIETENGDRLGEMFAENNQKEEEGEVYHQEERVI